MQQNVNFKNRNGNTLSGIIHDTEKQPIAYALFAHCFTCTKNIKSANIIAQTLAENNIAVLRFDFTGLGASTGDFSDSNFSSNVNDLSDAANFLENNYQAHKLLVGHSLGGTAVLAAAPQIESADAVVSIGSPAKPEHILHLLECKLDKIEEQGVAEVNLAGREFTFKQEFVDDVRSYDIDFRNINKALMVMHSPFDTTVSIDEAADIFSQAMHPKSFVSLDDADHLLTTKQHASYAANVIFSWSLRYIEKNIN